MKARYWRLLIEDLVLRSLVWVFIGAAFGFVFIAAVELMRGTLPQAWLVSAAVVAASVLTSLVYGSMRLAVIVANSLLVVALGFVALAGPPRELGLPMMLLACATIGALIGGVYGWRDTRSNVWCADAKLVAALAASLPAALLALLWERFRTPELLGYPEVLVLLAPLTGSIYVTYARWFVGRCHMILPPFGGGMLVGLGTGCITGMMYILFAGLLDESVAQQLQPFYAQVEANLGPGALASVTGCAMLGVVRSLLHRPWYSL